MVPSINGVIYGMITLVRIIRKSIRQWNEWRVFWRVQNVKPIRLKDSVLFEIPPNDFHKRAIKIRDFKSTDYKVYQQIFIQNELDSLIDVLRKKVNNKTLLYYVDVGMNIGLSGAYIKEHFPSARTIGVEPFRENFDIAKLNCEYQSVYLAGLGVSDTEKFTSFDEEYGHWGIRVRPDDNGDIDAISLSALLDQLPQDSFKVIKMDIEGAEFRVINSDSFSQLKNFNVILVEIHSWHGDKVELLNLIYRELQIPRKFQHVVMGEYDSFIEV